MSERVKEKDWGERGRKARREGSAEGRKEDPKP